MNWKESCRSRLPASLDAVGDLMPPWEKFPTYERFTIGWRMGAGEDWLGLWNVFLDDLDRSSEARVAYLRRHPPAPETWADSVHEVLHPTSNPGDSAMAGDDDELSFDERYGPLREAGLIASDIAYETWLSQQGLVVWPWKYSKTPEDAARYRAREFWFWSRRVVELRKDTTWSAPEVPEAWESCSAPLRSGELPAVDLSQGLRTLAQMLASGRVVPPWQLSLTLDDFTDSFEMDMGFTDAFRNWGLSAFDDLAYLKRYLAETEAPEVWHSWCMNQFAGYFG